MCNSLSAVDAWLVRGHVLSACPAVLAGHLYSLVQLIPMDPIKVVFWLPHRPTILWFGAHDSVVTLPVTLPYRLGVLDPKLAKNPMACT